MVGQFTGYAIEKERRSELRESAVTFEALPYGDLPVRVDPRQSALASVGWLRVEDQLRQGSCQGQALSDCVEFCYPLFSNGQVIQISRQYCYIRSQMFDNIRGDNGSTLSGGTKVALEGVPLESDAPYRTQYPGWDYITNEMREKAVYKLRSHAEITGAKNAFSFLGSGLGMIQLGSLWNDSMTPDRYGCIRSFSGRNGGGHSYGLVGYVPDEDVQQKSSTGRWGLLKNSWNVTYGINGYAYIDENALNAIFNNSWSSAYGRSDMDAPKPRPIPVDFTKESLLS
jgi:C1A family cysteine protease